MDARQNQLRKSGYRSFLQNLHAAEKLASPGMHAEAGDDPPRMCGSERLDRVPVLRPSSHHRRGHPLLQPWVSGLQLGGLGFGDSIL